MDFQMSNHSESAPSSRYIKVAAIAFAIAFGLHGADHLLRGMATSPMPVMVGGLIQGIFVVVAVALILRERPLALPGRHLRGLRQRRAVRVRAPAADVCGRLSGQLRIRTADWLRRFAIATGEPGDTPNGLDRLRHNARRTSGRALSVKLPTFASALRRRRQIQSLQDFSESAQPWSKLALTGGRVQSSSGFGL
jgi:hypothetical protein